MPNLNQLNPEEYLRAFRCASGWSDIRDHNTNLVLIVDNFGTNGQGLHLRTASCHTMTVETLITYETPQTPSEKTKMVRVGAILERFLVFRGVVSGKILT